MSVENATSPAVQLFQKAHQQMVLLARVDEQFVQLMHRRKTLLDELRAVQSQINDQFQRVIDSPSELGNRMARLDGAGANGNTSLAQRMEDPALA